jgi:hypothetical protein
MLCVNLSLAGSKNNPLPGSWQSLGIVIDFYSFFDKNQWETPFFGNG